MRKGNGGLCEIGKSRMFLLYERGVCEGGKSRMSVLEERWVRGREIENVCIGREMGV